MLNPVTTPDPDNDSQPYNHTPSPYPTTPTGLTQPIPHTYRGRGPTEFIHAWDLAYREQERRLKLEARLMKRREREAIETGMSTETEMSTEDKGSKKKKRSCVQDVEDEMVSFQLPEPHPRFSSKGVGQNLVLFMAEVIDEVVDHDKPEPMPGNTNDDPFVGLYGGAKNNFDEYAKSLLKRYAAMRSFYSSNIVNWRTCKERKGTRIDENRSAQVIVNTAKGTMDKSHPGRIHILAIGDGQFKGAKQVADKSSGRRGRLATKAIDNGVRVYQVDEFLTSCRCNRCGGETKAAKQSLVCHNSSCDRTRTAEQTKGLGLGASKGLLIDRDRNATGYMHALMMSQLTTLTRPEYLNMVKVAEQP